MSIGTTTLAPLVGEGCGLWWGQGAGEPVGLVDALLDLVQKEGAGPDAVTAFSGLSLNPRFDRDLPEGLDLLSYGALGKLRKVAAAGRLGIVPAHYSALPRLFARGALPRDVGLLQVSVPGPDGRVSLGVAVDYLGDALEHTATLVAEINHAMPYLEDAPTLPLSAFAATVEVDRPLPEMVSRPADAVDRAIAARVAALVPDGATLQLGVGSLPDAVLSELSDHRDLGVHSGMITDAVMDLVDAGVITGSRKEVDAGLVVAGSALGSRALYARLAGEHRVSFRSASRTHHPGVLSRFAGLVSVNSALSVDLTGQVGAERAAGRWIGAIGGQADFSRAAALTGDRSIIALRSTSKGASTITPVLDGGLVTTARADVDTVVTEHGAAHLTGATEAVAARRLIAVAAPEHREDLTRAAVEAGVLARTQCLGGGSGTAGDRRSGPHHSQEVPA